MPDLKTLQAAFKQHLTTGGGAIADYIVGTERVPAETRLDIYANAYHAILEEALETDYKILQKLLGESIFTELCTAYIQKHPSRHFSLREFGRNLPRFLNYHSDTGEHHWPAEMAQLEWAFIDTFDAADATPITEADAAAIAPDAWPKLTIQFHPSVRLVAIWWNTLARWRAIKQNEPVLPEARRLSQPAQCLLWRDGLTTQYRSLEVDETCALQSALDGESFAELCGALAEELQNQETVAMQAAGFLKGWLGMGMVVELGV
jgi:hypothetical protein